PGGKAMRVHPPFHMLQYAIPGSHRCHAQRQKGSNHFISTDVEILWKWAGSTATAPAFSFGCLNSGDCRPSLFLQSRTPLPEATEFHEPRPTKANSPRSASGGQEKNLPRQHAGCTAHAQDFHRREFSQRARKKAIDKGNLPRNSVVS